MTTLYGWGRAFGTASVSAFVAKAEIHMQMLGLSFTRAVANLEQVSKHKAPYVEDDGKIIQDSNFIRWHFEQKLGADLDAGLDADARAVAWATERMLEDHLAPIMTLERWVEGDNFERGPLMFFSDVPEPMRAEVAGSVRNGLRDTLYAQGIGRHSRDERMRLAAKDIAAVAALLGDKPFMLADHPTALDGAAFGVIASCNAPIFETELKSIVAAHDNLVGFIERMEQKFFAEDRWPSMMQEEPVSETV